jgi:transcriptional regulator with XRE-family HTH domain
VAWSYIQLDILPAMASSRLIREARTAAGLTQTELSRRSGTSQATLSAYENSQRVPSAATLERILAGAGRRLSTVPAARPLHSPNRADLEERGRILVDVLALAEALPFDRRRALRYPRLRAVTGGEP